MINPVYYSGTNADPEDDEKLLAEIRKDRECELRNIIINQARFGKTRMNTEMMFYEMGCFRFEPCELTPEQYDDNKHYEHECSECKATENLHWCRVAMTSDSFKRLCDACIKKLNDKIEADLAEKSKNYWYNRKVCPNDEPIKRVSRLRRYWNKVKALIARLRASESEG